MEVTEVTTEGRLWAAHNHRHHPRPGDLPPVWGPIGPSDIEGPSPATAPELAGDTFIFWSASGTVNGGSVSTQPILIGTDIPTFPPGRGTSGTLTAWYLGPGGGNGGDALIFDAFSETAGDWLDWDDTNQPFTVSPAAARGAGDDDDTASTAGAKGLVTVTAADPFPGAPLLAFDHWLTIGAGTAIGAGGPAEVTQEPNTSGLAFAVYRQVTPAKPPSGPRFVPQWWEMGDPARALLVMLAQQSELTRSSTLLDLSASVTDRATRDTIQQALLGSVQNLAQVQLESLKSQGD
jgi:hypothetical protein